MTNAQSIAGDGVDPDIAGKIPGDTEDIGELGQSIADQVSSFLLSLRAMSRSEDLSTDVPLLLLQVSQLLLAGGRLGAIGDVVPAERFEPDAGPDPDLDRLRERLAERLSHIDEFCEVFDPYGHPEIVTSRISDDLADVASSLAHGLQHHRAGRVDEALWWWQFSYLSSWGPEASAVLRALQSVVAHDRLDTQLPEMVEAEEAATVEALEQAVRAVD